MKRIFGTDGIRGIVNKELTAELALLTGKAVGSILVENKKTRVVVGKDTRISCDMLENALISGLCSVGVDVVLAGITPTPSVAFFCKNFDAGVMISASHNSYEFNGIKIFDGNGYKLSDVIEEKIEKIVTGEESPKVSKKIGKIIKKNLNKTYINHIEQAVNLKNLKNLKIAFDLANGAAISTAPGVFVSCANNFKFLNNKSNGININENCGSLHTDILSEFVTKNNFDMGIAFDGDADRCLAIDEKGNLVDGDTIMAICALYMRKNGSLSKNTVVGTVMTNFGFNKFCKENKIEFVSTKVGDKYVLTKMLEEDFNLGGEQSGHIVFRDFSTTGDGQLTAAFLIKILEESGKKLSELASCIKKFPQIIINLKATDEQKKEVFNLNEVLKKFEKELNNDGRMIVRPSGTEPLVRIMIEWANSKEIKPFAKRVSKFIEEKIKNVCPAELTFSSV